MAEFLLNRNPEKDKNIIMKIETLTARTMCERENEKMNLLIEAHARFCNYEMDVDDSPPSDHRIFMEKLASVIQATNNE